MLLIRSILIMALCYLFFLVAILLKATYCSTVPVYQVPGTRYCTWYERYPTTDLVVNQWPLAGGTPTTLYSIWTYDNDRNLKYLTRVNSNPYDLLSIFGPMMMIVT